MKTSARNQLAGTVRQIKAGAVNDAIEVELSGGDKLVAVITSDSTRHLRLSSGSQVIALIKAPWVIIAVDMDNVRISARNQLQGTVQQLLPGAVNTEVVLKLKGGDVVTAIITNDSAQALGLTVGRAATAIIKASHVILAALT